MSSKKWDATLLMLAVAACFVFGGRDTDLELRKLLSDKMLRVVAWIFSRSGVTRQPALRIW